MGFFRYPGGKRKLSKLILPKIKSAFENDSNLVEYREPFFGGGSIGLEVLNFNVKSFWFNDYDYGIHCLWHSVINYPDELKTLVLEFKPSVALFYKIKEELSNNNLSSLSEKDKILFGFYKLAIHQISYSGLGVKSGGPLGGKKQKSKYNISCRWSPQYISKKIDFYNKSFNINNIKNFTCSCFDFSNLIIDNNSNSFLYLDPPYFVKGNELYQFSFSTEDHLRLRNFLSQTKHKWLLSYDLCDEVINLYKNISNIERVSGVNYSINTSRKKFELLISNY